MRLQHISVMFVLIFIPIILVTSYFISLQVNTIKLESDYSDKLLSATYDAMTAFELNTANEDLSTVTDSLRSILDASTNIFFNTLCTNLGISNASKTFVQPYIPSILYTMYDGYYIYSPTNIPEICTDKYGRTIRTSDLGVKFIGSDVSGKIGFYEFNNNAIKYNENTHTEPEGLNDDTYKVNYNDLNSKLKQEYGQILYKNNDGKTYSTELHTISGNRDQSTFYKRSYILKNYIPYSARYAGSTGAGPSRDQSYDFTINYTLDNFLTIEGSIGKTYYTKSGYLIESDLINEISVNGAVVNSWNEYSEEVLLEFINSPETNEVIVGLNDGTVISNQDGSVEVSQGTGSGSITEYWDDAQSALEYYVKSYIFSNWFYENLSGIKANTMQNTQYSVADVQDALTESIVQDNTGEDIKTNLSKYMLHSFTGDNSEPFAVSSGIYDNDPESEESAFYEHKRNVIKNSITYNLILSMLVYTEESATVEFNMPVLEESEWNTILNNVSITAFMQGMRCGLKFYNNYAIVTSTNNEISVTDDEIYYVPRMLEDADPVSGAKIVANLEDNEPVETAHRIDCEGLVLNGTDNYYNSNWLGCISFKSKEIKYDKILNKDGSYTYDHKAYTDYECIVDSNYTIRNVNGTREDGNTDVVGYLIRNIENASPIDTDLHNELELKLKAYRIAIAKERNNLYKTTAFPENYGWQVVNNPSSGGGTSTTINLAELTKKNINEIEKVEVTIENAENNTVGVYTDEISAKYDSGDEYTDKQTISTTSKSRRTLEFKQDFNSGSNVNKITISSGNGTTFNVNAVKVYYK